MIIRRICPPQLARHRRGGFTLVEMIVALGVISVAAMIFVSMFRQSLDLGKAARNRTVASQLAEEALNDILSQPSKFHWVKSDDARNVEYAVTASPESATLWTPVASPYRLPEDSAAQEREVNLYEGFEWRAFGRLPSPDAAFAELSVHVQWHEAGKRRGFVLTSAVPRTSVSLEAGAAAQS